jgi:hypothetical protein
MGRGYEQLQECGTMTKARYDQVCKVLALWDESSPGERRVMADGNHNYWHKTYALSPGQSAGERVLMYRDTQQIVVHQDNLFQTIKDVHVQSTLAPTLCALHGISSEFALRCLCSQSFTPVIGGYTRRV